MIRILLFFLPAIISIAGLCQENKTGITIPMRNGIVFYEKTFRLAGTVSKIERLGRIEQWFKSSFPGSTEKIMIDPATGTFSSKGLLKVITDSGSGHYYWIKPAISISIKNDSCRFQSYNYYEKPIMPGVTNDYSKIEYRWWDFRQGKPWNKKDEALFKGLDRQTLEMIRSFESALQN